MEKHVEINYLDVKKNKEWEELIGKVVSECFVVEGIEKSGLYVSITLTTPAHIREYNKEYRKIDKETDVLSFPIYDKDEIEDVRDDPFEDVLGDIVISIERVKEQAEEYGHSFERELAYMCVHGFYHLMGEDHIKEEDKVKMRAKEENVLGRLYIVRE